MSIPPNPEDAQPPTPEQPVTPEPPVTPEQLPTSAQPQMPIYAPPPQQPPASQAPAAPQVPPLSQAPQYAPPPQMPPVAPAQPQAPQYGVPPQAPQYGVPPQAPQYGATPQAPQYGVPPQAPQYGVPPQAPQYGATPQAPQYAPQPQYTQQPQYAAQAPYPAAPNYSQYGVAGEPGPGEPFDGAASPEDLSRPLYGASFGQAVRRFFKNYTNFNGRASRSEYWWFQLFYLLISLVPLAIYIIGLSMTFASAATVGYDYRYSSGGNEASAVVGGSLVFIGLGLLLVISLGTLIPGLALVWRRLHDGNFAGPLYFLALIPYVGGLVLLVFMFLPSSPAGRRFDQRH